MLELLCCGGGCCCSVGQVLYIVFCKLLPAVIMLSVLSVTLGLFCFVWVFFFTSFLVGEPARAMGCFGAHHGTFHKPHVSYVAP